MVSIGATSSTDSDSNAVVVVLNTTFGEEERVPIQQAIQIEEILVVFIVVLFWIVAFMAFLKKWDSIRIMQPVEPRYNNNPKNLENIKIVKRPQDSIIYKNYSRKMSTTMVEREKRRLQRMNTIACMGSTTALPTDRSERARTGEATTEI